ncbi:hypothetical protein [Chryseobacterium sp. MMS23-Vi53]|uniref:hypothetical protein n=1 Tax=Chryseobacterium sp. MMS23-Vi53 TaxID=3386644 RepID=UPI0039EC7F78
MKIYTLVILFFLLGCKKSDSQNLKQTQTISLHNNNNLTEEKITCYDIIKKIVESSDLNLSMYKGNYNIRIENMQSDSIIIQVYTENNLSNNPNKKQLVESTIAWLAFVPKNKKLINTTSNPQNPINLKYKYLKLDELYKVCGIESKENIVVDQNVTAESKKEDCRKIEVEMGSGEECIIKNTLMIEVYEDLIKNKKIDDSNLLIPKLPNANKEFKIGKSGLISIEYRIQESKIQISMLYEGGLTEILIEQEGKNVKRTIIYNAD